jgi:hypothetical protein
MDNHEPTARKDDLLMRGHCWYLGGISLFAPSVESAVWNPQLCRRDDTWK